MCFQLAAELAKHQKFEKKFDNRKPKGGEKAAGFKKDKKEQGTGKLPRKLKGKPAADQTKNGKAHKDKHKKDTQGKKINNSANFEPVVYKRKVSEHYVQWFLLPADNTSCRSLWYNTMAGLALEFLS